MRDHREKENVFVRVEMFLKMFHSVRVEIKYFYKVKRMERDFYIFVCFKLLEFKK